MKTLQPITLGFTAPPIREQVKAPASVVRAWQRKSDAIHLLYLDGYITQAQKHRMCQRLFAEMRRHFTKAGGAK